VFLPTFRRSLSTLLVADIAMLLPCRDLVRAAGIATDAQRLIPFRVASTVVVGAVCTDLATSQDPPCLDDRRLAAVNTEARCLSFVAELLRSWSCRHLGSPKTQEASPPIGGDASCVNTPVDHASTCQLNA
jgi:hypothetical protein